MGRLIIDGNSVYEVDEECLRKRRVPPECKVLEAIERQKRQERNKAGKSASTPRQH